MKSTVMRVEECCAFPASQFVVHSHCLPTLKAEAIKLLPSAEVTLCPQQHEPESGRKGQVVNLFWSVWLCPGQGDLLPRKVASVSYQRSMWTSEKAQDRKAAQRQ